MSIYKFLSKVNKSTRQNAKILVGLFILLSLLIPQLNHSAKSKTTEELQADLNAQIDGLSQIINQYRDSVAEIRNKAQTLKNEISLLDNQIKEFELEIQQLNLQVQSLTAAITEIETRVAEIEKQTNNEKLALGEIVREIYKTDDISFLEMILTVDEFSDFFSKAQAVELLQTGLRQSLEEILAFKKQLENQRASLAAEKEEMLTLKAVQETQKYAIEAKRSERNKILTETKGQESLYQKLVDNKQKDINTIRSQLYVLQGMGGAISFENALNIAKFAAGATGIRPALVMAILSRESGLGKNVGTGTWREDMKPSQQQTFLDLCQKLGLNPDLMPVSKKAWYGWGGAMGPAQFIPTTWLGYTKRVATITGHNPPSPWDIEDAFVASALYLANAGATAQTYNAEWKAAMIYLAGSNWDKPYLRFYGDQVMDLATQIQDEINLLK